MRLSVGMLDRLIFIIFFKSTMIIASRSPAAQRGSCSHKIIPSALLWNSAAATTNNYSSASNTTNSGAADAALR